MSGLWHDLSHRPDIPPHLRCELLITLRTGEFIKGLLDVLPADFASLPRVTSRAEGMEASRSLDSAPSITEWLLREGEVLFLGALTGAASRSSSEASLAARHVSRPISPARRAGRQRKDVLIAQTFW